MSLMVEAGITSTFIGIETPEEKSLQDCKKSVNLNRDLLRSVKMIQHAGIQVKGGFIVGFDSDTPGVFDKQINFIRESSIVIAMVGLLNAPKHTRLYLRLEAENRLTVEATGNNTDYSMNFIPTMNSTELLAGYEKIIHAIYETKPYYQRIRQFLLHYKPLYKKLPKSNVVALRAFLRSILIIGLLNKGRRDYWRLLAWTLFRRPALLIDAITFSIYGYHFRKVYGL